MGVMRHACLGINQPETPPSFILGKPFPDEELYNLLGYANASAARSHKDRALILYRNSSPLYRINDSGKDNRPRPLDIIIEASECISIPGQCRERILEVFKLYHDAVFSLAELTRTGSPDNVPRPLLAKCRHQLIQELLLLLWSHLFLSAAHIQGVFPKTLVVCAQVEGERQCVVWMYTCAASVAKPAS